MNNIKDYLIDGNYSRCIIIDGGFVNGIMG